MVSIRKPIQTIRSSFIPNHKMEQCSESTCAPAAALAFARAQIRGAVPEAEEAAAVDVAADKVALKLPQHRRHPKQVRRTPNLSRALVAALAAARICPRMLFLRRRRTNSTVFTGTRPSSCRRTIRA